MKAEIDKEGNLVVPTNYRKLDRHETVAKGDFYAKPTSSTEMLMVWEETNLVGCPVGGHTYIRKLEETGFTFDEKCAMIEGQEKMNIS